MTKIGILDYGVGNVKSISNAVSKVGRAPVLTNNQDILIDCDGLIIPGVGAFSHGMEKLKSANLVKFIKSYAKSGKPVLGICLGMQLLFSDSEEFGFSAGLNLIPGSVKKLDSSLPEKSVKLKLPNVGWRNIDKANHSWDKTILEGVEKDDELYFVHSFAVLFNDQNSALSTSTYEGIKFCSTVMFNNIYGCQFHPEKSSIIGLKIINNFCNISEINKDKL